MKLKKVFKMRSSELNSADNLPVLGESGMNRNGMRVRSNAKAAQTLGVLMPPVSEDDDK